MHVMGSLIPSANSFRSGQVPYSSTFSTIFRDPVFIILKTTTAAETTFLTSTFWLTNDSMTKLFFTLGLFSFPLGVGCHLDDTLRKSYVSWGRSLSLISCSDRCVCFCNDYRLGAVWLEGCLAKGPGGFN